MICDTSGLLSAHIAGQPHHEESLAALNSGERLVIPPLALCEIDLLAARHGREVTNRILDELSQPEYEIARFGHAEMLQALSIMTTYADLHLGLTDASVVVLAKLYATNEILTLDQSHFRAIRGLDGRHFKLLPVDTG